MRLTTLAFSLALAACTNGAPGATTTASLPAGGATAIDVSLTSFGPAASAFGLTGGYSPPVTQVTTGTFVRFVNQDGFAHTATSIAGTTFPAASPFDSSALAASGQRLSTGWSTGTLAANGSSGPILADLPGTYLYGCFFHYGAPMHGAIVVR